MKVEIQAEGSARFSFFVIQHQHQGGDQAQNSYFHQPKDRYEFHSSFQGRYLVFVFGVRWIQTTGNQISILGAFSLIQALTRDLRQYRIQV